MPTVKLTGKSVARIPAPDPSGKQKLIWDAEVKGFGVLASGVTATRSFVVQRGLDDGRTRRITIGAVGEIDLDDARAKAADLIHQMRHGIDPKAVRRSAANWTLRRALDEYVLARKTLAPKTVRLYRAWLAQHLDAWMDRPLRTITPDEVEDRHRAIRAEIAARKLQPAHFKSQSGANTANRVLQVLGIVWNFVLDRDPSLPANPIRRLKRQWYDEPRRARLVLADQLPVFYAGITALSHRVFADYLRFLLFTGMRREEAARLTWDMVDFAARTVRVPADETKTTAFDLPMSAFIRDLLITRRALGDSHYVFPGQGGGPIGDPRAYFKEIARNCGVAVSAHDLRRTYITVAESLDLSPWALKALVNHTLCRGDTTGGYLVLSNERLRDAAQKVCDRLIALIGLPAPAADNLTRLA